MSVVEHLSKAVALDSSLKRGTFEMAQFFCDTAQKLGLYGQVVEERYNGRAQGILIVSNTKDFSQCRLVSLVPIETENPGHMALWSKTHLNPFALNIEDNCAYGLGVARKSSLLAQMHALQKSQLKDVALVGSFGAESGEAVLRLLRRKIVQPKLAIVHAPTNMKLATQGAGFARIEIKIAFSEEEKQARKEVETSTGSTTQSKIFSAGKTDSFDYFENPVSRMLTYFQNLPDNVLVISAEGGSSDTTWPDSVWLEMDVGSNIQSSVGPKLLKLNEMFLDKAKDLRAIKAEGFEPNHSTFNIGRVRTYQEGLKMAGSCRLVPATDKSIYEKWLSSLKEKADTIGAKVELLAFREPYSLHLEDSRLKELCKSAGVSLASKAPGCTAANLLGRFQIPSFVFGPGNQADTGSVVNESVSLNDLEASVSIYQKMYEAQL